MDRVVWAQDARNIIWSLGKRFRSINYIDKRQCNRNLHRHLLLAVRCSVCVEIPKSVSRQSQRQWQRVLFLFIFFLSFLGTHPNMPYGLFAFRSIHIQYFSRIRLTDWCFYLPHGLESCLVWIYRFSVSIIIVIPSCSSLGSGKKNDKKNYYLPYTVAAAVAAAVCHAQFQRE